jgi:hypothetical protein
MSYNYLNLIKHQFSFIYSTNLPSAIAPHFAQKIFAYWSLDNTSNSGVNKFVKIYKGDKYLNRLGKSRMNCSEN